MPNLMSGPVTSKPLTVTLFAFISMAATRSVVSRVPIILAWCFLTEKITRPVLNVGMLTFSVYSPGDTQTVPPATVLLIAEFMLWPGFTIVVHVAAWTLFGLVSCLYAINVDMASTAEETMNIFTSWGLDFLRLAIFIGEV